MIKPGTECSWCGDAPASQMILATPTCVGCAVGRSIRLARYHERLQRSATPKRKERPHE